MNSLKSDSDPQGLTLVMPVYNRAHQVGRTLASIAGQTRLPDEVILVDNASTDATPQVLRAWAESMAGAPCRVRILTEPRRGASQARQTGLEHVATDYVMFFDSDDIMTPRHIEVIMTDFKSDPALDMTVWNVRFVRADGSTRVRRMLPHDVWQNHMVQGLLGTQSYAVRTDFLRRCGGWRREIGGWDDWELGVRLLLQNPRMRISCEPRVDITVQADSITGLDFSHRAGDWERALDLAEQAIMAKAEARQMQRLLTMIAYRRLNLAAHYRREGEPGQATGLRLRAMKELERTGIRPALWKRVLLSASYHHTASVLPAAGAIYPPLLMKF